MVDNIKYKKRNYPVKIGFTAFQNTLAHSEEKGNIILAISKDAGLLKTLLYYSLEMGAKLNDKEFKFTMDDMDLVMEECYWEFFGLYNKEITAGSKRMEKVMGTVEVPSAVPGK